jgi:hypothetical protein
MLNVVSGFLDQSSPALIKIPISGHLIGESAIVGTLDQKPKLDRLHCWNQSLLAKNWTQSMTK